MTRMIASSCQNSSSTPLCQPQLPKNCSISGVVQSLFIFESIWVNLSILCCVPHASEPLGGLVHGCSTSSPEAVSGASSLVPFPLTLAASTITVNVTEVTDSPLSQGVPSAAVSLR